VCVCIPKAALVAHIAAKEAPACGRRRGVVCVRRESLYRHAEKKQVSGSGLFCLYYVSFVCIRSLLFVSGLFCLYQVSFAVLGLFYRHVEKSAG
jgi:hypothetical protein